MVVVDIVWCFLIYEQIQNQQLIGKMLCRNSCIDRAMHLWLCLVYPIT